MIRQATRSDVTTIAELLIEFLDNTSYDKHIAELNPIYIKHLAYAAVKTGYVWVYEKDGIIVGLLIAIKEQNAWIPTLYTLRELVWYVKEEYRNSPSAGRLFVQFCKTGEQLLEDGKIVAYVTTRMATTSEYDLTKRGFRLTEKLYIKD